MEEQGGTASVTKKKHEDKHRKKDPRSWENISKAVANLSNEDKLVALEEKYVELYNESRRTQGLFTSVSRQCAVLQKELEQKQAELTKSMVARARLENLCRELQKQNKQIKDENMLKIKEEEERRKEVSQKFADKLNDINVMMDENKDKSEKLREENLKMTAKFADLYQQFQKREQDISKMAHQMELERQFSQATVAKMQLEIKAEKELYAKEQDLTKSNLEKSEANCKVLVETVKGLQDHVDLYKNQYQDFENTMSKSNKAFDNFKVKMSSMSKQMGTLEKDAQSWKVRYQDSMRVVLELTEMKKNQDLFLQSSERKIEQLQKLCRQLQVDRASFLKLLKENGIEPASQNTKTEEGESEKKMTKKEKELELLKDNLKAIQNELTKFSVDADPAQVINGQEAVPMQIVSEEQSSPNIVSQNNENLEKDEHVIEPPTVISIAPFEVSNTTADGGSVQ